MYEMVFFFHPLMCIVCQVSKQNKYGDTLLHLASAGGWTEAIKLLVKLGADRNAKNTFGETPLHRVKDACFLFLLD